MSNVLRKKITIASNCALTVYGGTFGPIRTPFYETIPNIARLICDGIEVYEETPNGKVRLTMSNFDKFQDDEARIAKENEAARAAKAKAEAEEAAKAKAEAEEAARVRAQQEQRAREEQQRNNQRNNQKNNNQRNNNNQQQQQPKQVTADVIVEE